MKNNVKKTGFCLALISSFFVFFACNSLPPAASTPDPTSQQPSDPVSSRTTDLILDGAETYTVVIGDTLSKISRNKYQNGFYYPLIMMASKDVVKDQDLIEVGMRLTIPRLQVNLDDPRARASIKKYILEIALITERKRPSDAAGLRNLANSL